MSDAGDNAAGSSARTEAGRARQVELILQQVDALPTLSPVATRLLSVSSVDEADLDELVGLLETDPSMTARILSLVRRADKGANQDNITTVRRAVIMLGLEAVQAAVLAVCVYELFDRAGHDLDRHAARGPGGVFDRVGFWRHSVAVACAAQSIARAHPGKGVTPDEAFVAGLLHDIGKLVLELVLPRSYGRVLELAEHRGVDSAGVERELIGLDHHTAGKRLATRWGLGRSLAEVMWLHSQPLRSLPDVPGRAMIELVTVAKALCRRLHVGWSGDFAPDADLATLCLEAQLETASVEGAAQGLHAEVGARCSALGLDETSSPELLLASIATANRRLSRMNDALQARAAQSQQQRAVLEAIGAFHAAGAPQRSVVEAFSEIVRSAGEVFGSGFYGIVFQPAPGELWHVHQFSADGHLVRSQLMEPPPGGADGPQDLGSIGTGRGLRVGVMGLIPWLSDFLMDAGDVRRVRILPLRVVEGDDLAGAVPGGAAAALLHDREPEGEGLTDRLLEPLVATWAWAFNASAQFERAQRLGERLAESNRSLAEAQARLTEAASMARLGEMAAGAAHEMNNPLTVISGRCQLLADRAANPQERAAAKAVVAAARQLTDLITSLHLIADPPEPRLVPTAVSDVLTSAVREARTRTGAMGDVRVTVPAGLRLAPMDRELIERAVHELVLNAIESDPTGLVEVTAAVDGVDDRLVISVRDYGPGLSERGLKHAFDPFFSEKPAGRQCGLGLSRARRMAELHAGTLRIENVQGGGVLARLTLPMRHERDEALFPPIEREAA